SGGEAVRLERDVRPPSLDDRSLPAIVIAMLAQGESSEIVSNFSERARGWHNLLGCQSEPVRACCSVPNFDCEPLVGKSACNTLCGLLGRHVDVEIYGVRFRQIGAGDA